MFHAGPSSTRAAAAVHSSSSSDGSGCPAIRVRLRTEVLDDHLLHVPVALAELADREQRLDSLRARLADPDQDAGREGDGCLAREPQRLQPPRRELVRRPEVRPAARRQSLGGRLQHDPLRGAHAPKRASSSRRPSPPDSRAAGAPSPRARPGPPVRDTRASSRTKPASSARAARYRSSGLSPSVKSASCSPPPPLRARPRAPRRSTCTPSPRAVVAARTCSSGRRRGRASSAG